MLRLIPFFFLLFHNQAFSNEGLNLLVQGESITAGICREDFSRYQNIFYGENNSFLKFIFSGSLVCSSEEQNPQSIDVEFLYEGPAADIENIKASLDQQNIGLRAKPVERIFFSSYVYLLGEKGILGGFEIPNTAKLFSDVVFYKDERKAFLQRAKAQEIRDWILQQLKIKDRIRWEQELLPQTQTLQMQIYTYLIDKNGGVSRLQRVYLIERNCKTQGC